MRETCGFLVNTPEREPEREPECETLPEPNKTRLPRTNPINRIITNTIGRINACNRRPRWFRNSEKTPALMGSPLGNNVRTGSSITGQGLSDSSTPTTASPAKSCFLARTFDSSGENHSLPPAPTKYVVPTFRNLVSCERYRTLTTPAFT